MTEQLLPEVRLKVAGECVPKDWCKNSYGEVVVIENCWPYGGGGYMPNTTAEWLPEKDFWQKDALTRTVAREIGELAEINSMCAGEDYVAFGNKLYKVQDYDSRLRVSIATDDVPALERLLAELRGWL
jgi:hypothetical protein